MPQLEVFPNNQCGGAYKSRRPDSHRHTPSPDDLRQHNIASTYWRLVEVGRSRASPARLGIVMIITQPNDPPSTLSIYESFDHTATRTVLQLACQNSPAFGNAKRSIWHRLVAGESRVEPPRSGYKATAETCRSTGCWSRCDVADPSLLAVVVDSLIPMARPD